MIMTIFTFDIEWDSAINYSFDQDDVKTVGKVRVAGKAVVVAPDQELAEFHLKRTLKHYALEIKGVSALAINLMVTTRVESITPIRQDRKIGPEEIVPHWKERITNDRWP